MADPLWRFEEAVEAVNGASESTKGPDLASVSIDSRTLEPGALFVAIVGERLDGHDYVGKAFAAGAAAALVAESYEAGPDDGPLIRVADTLAGLERLAAASRARSSARVIAVTGSVGKTGTKEALRLALAPSGATHASEKSYNNLWGVPLSLANMARETRFGVFEIGMSAPGEIVPLTRMVRPHVAIVTTVEPVHLGFFNSVTEIAEAKAEIFQGLEPGGTAIVNRDNAYFELLSQRAREAGAETIVSFGADANADVQLLDAALHAEHSEVRARVGGAEIAYRLGAPGRHVVINSLAVLAAAERAGADLAAADALAGYTAQPGRGARSVFQMDGGQVAIIDESYNANPASMRAALAILGGTPRDEFPRRIAVLGDMLELGEAGPDLHRELAEAVDAAGVDVVLACGPLMEALVEALPEGRVGAYGARSQDIETALIEAVRPGDVIMIKGSLGSRMGPLVEALTAHLTGSGAAGAGG